MLSADNHLFDLARTGRLRIPSSLSAGLNRTVDLVLYPLATLVGSLAIPFIALIALLPILALFVLLSRGNPALPASGNAGSMLQLVLGFLPIYFLVWAWLWLFEGRHLWTVGLERPGSVRKYLRGVVIGLLMFVAVVAILAAVDTVTFEGADLAGEGPALLGGALFLLVGWMVQGGAEEVLTRGFLFPILGIRYGVMVGIIISSLAFATLHMLNPNLTAIGIMNQAIFGVFAALFALYEGGLWGIAAIHSVWNWAQGNLFGFSVSGGAESTTVFNAMEVGPDWLTGGAFGPEGGLVVTAVLVGASGLVWLAHRRRARGESREAGH